MAGSFVILRFGEPATSDVVYIESQAGDLFLESDTDLSRFNAIFERLRALALPPDASVSLIQATAPWGQPDDPNWMGTVMAWVAAQVRAPGVSCQMVSLVRWTARASQPPVLPGARVAVPGGRVGSGCQERAVPVMVRARLPVRITAAAPPRSNEAVATFASPSGNGCDRDQWAPPSVDHAASRCAADPVPVTSRAVVVPDVVVSLSTVTFWWR
jgi:hypothetical protein